MTRQATVLFVCVHNAGRSQIAAALLNHYGMGRIDVRSAGSAPGEQINPAAALVLKEWGVDLVDAHPKLLDPRVVEHSDIVITMGRGDTCPIFPGVKYEDWALGDPADQPVERVRQIKDEIDWWVRKLISEMLD